MGHTAAETSPKYGQPFFPRGLPQLEQLHHLQVKLCAALKDSIQLLELPVLDLSALWISDYRSCSGVLTSSLKALTQPVLLGFWGGLYFLPSVLKL